MAQTDFQEEINAIIQRTVPLIYQADLDKKLSSGGNVVLLDAREKKEFDVSHIKNAHFVGYKTFSERDVAGMNKSDTVVVYCSVGYRSEKIGEQLQEMGFKHVFNLYGGIFEWKNNGQKVVNKSGVTDSVHTYNRKWSQWLENGVKVY